LPTMCDKAGAEPWKEAMYSLLLSLKVMESVTLDSIKQGEHFCEFCKGLQRCVI